MIDKFIDICGIFFIVFMIYIIVIITLSYIKRILNKQTKIKCLCKHEYEQYGAFYFKGIEYEFKCRKCGKKISVQTVTNDKFDWVVKE